MKRIVRLTESDLARIVRRVLNEGILNESVNIDLPGTGYKLIELSAMGSPMCQASLTIQSTSNPKDQQNFNDSENGLNKINALQNANLKSKLLQFRSAKRKEVGC